MAKEIYAGGRKDESAPSATSRDRRAEAALKAAPGPQTRSDLRRGRRRPGQRSHRAATMPAWKPMPTRSSPWRRRRTPRPPRTRPVTCLVAGLLFRAGRRLARTQPAYARMAEKTRLSTSDTLPGRYRAQRREPAPRRGAAGCRRPPGRRPDPRGISPRPGVRGDPWTWSLLRGLIPMRPTGWPRPTSRTSPPSSPSPSSKGSNRSPRQSALSGYWAAEMAGKSADGRAILKEYAARGVPLPIESP